MDNKVIMVDTSILIDYYRKTDKSKSEWISLVRQDYQFAISAITKYKIYSGATEQQPEFWDRIMQLKTIIPFDEIAVNTAVKINYSLKKKRKQIDIADLFIASTAMANNLPIATLNKKHFNRIDGLEII